ncbi:glycosyl hydrolase family 8 [Thalassococcus profundi]
MTPRIAFSQDGGAWQGWRDRFLSDDGRVIDDENGRISHSEGQGFGALLAQAHGDREAFELIEDWTRRNLLVRQDSLMGWRWNASTGVADEDWPTRRTATCSGLGPCCAQSGTPAGP